MEIKLQVGYQVSLIKAAIFFSILFLLLAVKVINLMFDDFFLIIPSLKLDQLRKHKLHLNKPVPPTKLIRVSFFSHRTITTGNHLSSDIVMSESLLLFKKKLNCYNIAISKM